MYLDHLHLRDHVVAVTCAGDTVHLSLRWQWEEIPYLFTLSDPMRLRWAHLDDPRGGVPVTLQRWRWWPDGAGPTRHGRPGLLQLRLQQVVS